MKTQIISAVLLLLSGFLITGAGAFFSVKGFLMFIPDPELEIGLLVLGIGFQIGLITASTFIFHKMSDRDTPASLKMILAIAVFGLTTLNAVFTFSHLNASVSKSMAAVEVIDGAKQRFAAERERLVASISNVDAQIEAVPKNTSVSNRIRMKNAYDTERQTIQTKLDKLDADISTASVNANSEDKFLFLNSISELFGTNKTKIFTVIVLVIVLLIDPLAITLILSGTLVIAQVLRKRAEPVQEAVVDIPTDVPELFPEIPPVVPETVAEIPSNPAVWRSVVVQLEAVSPPWREEQIAEIQAEAVALVTSLQLIPKVESEALPDHIKIEDAFLEPEVSTFVEVSPEPEEESIIVSSLEEQELRDELEMDSITQTPTTPVAKKFLTVRNHIKKDEVPNDPN